MYIDMKLSICMAGLLALMAYGGNVSSREVECRLDNGARPAVSVVGGGETMEVVLPFAGDILYVDGVYVATASEDGQTFALAGLSDAWRSYRLTLKSGDETITRVVTLVPSYGFSCLLHSLSLPETMLDSRPAGTIRRMRKDAIMDIAWSGGWSSGAAGAEVAIYSGSDASGTPLATLVSSEGTGEGICRFSPQSASLGSGRYTLTHFDGVETLVANLRLTRGCFVISVK